MSANGYCSGKPARVTRTVLIVWALVAIELGMGPRVDDTFAPTMAVLLGLVVLSGFGSAQLIRRWRSESAAARGIKRGYLERFAQRSPKLFERAWAFNGIGLRYLDFHDPRPKGWSTATLWLTFVLAPVAPVAPVRRERLRLRAPRRDPYRRGVERHRSATWRADVGGSFAELAGLRILLPVPVPADAWVIHHPSLPAWAFWGGLVACFAWGIALLFVEERWMRTPHGQ